MTVLVSRAPDPTKNKGLVNETALGKLLCLVSKWVVTLRI